MTDVGSQRGPHQISGTGPELTTLPPLIWAIAMVDIDADRDLDIMTADD